MMIVNSCFLAFISQCFDKVLVLFKKGINVCYLCSVSL